VKATNPLIRANFCVTKSDQISDQKC
jgi:hypothetical protein